jgi:hypothetical protein
MTGQQALLRRRPSPHCADAKPEVRRCYPLQNAAARPLTTGSPGGYGFLVEYPVKPHLRSPVSICAASNSWGAVSAAADASAGREDATPLLQDASR